MSPQEAVEVAAVIAAGLHDDPIPCLRCLASAACDLDRRLPGPNWYALIVDAVPSSKETDHWSEALLREASPCQPDDPDVGPL